MIPKEIQITLAEALAIAIVVNEDDNRAIRRFTEAARHLDLEVQVSELLISKRGKA